MSAVMTQIWGALRRKRLQSVIVAVVSAMAASTSILTITLLVRDNQPWDDACTAVACPHMLFHLDAGRVTTAQLNATATLPSVTAAGPARLAATIPFQKGKVNGPILVVERDSPAGSFDRLKLLSGRWPELPGEIAVAAMDPVLSPLVPQLGDTIDAVAAAHPTAFKVVGTVSDLTALSSTGGVSKGWVISGQLTNLIRGTAIRPVYEMPYRFAQASSDADLAADRKLIEKALPSGAEVSAPTNWTDMRQGYNWLVTAVGPIIFAFSVFAIIAVVLVVASVVAGTVMASFRDFGVAKALGFTPAQVVLLVMGQMAFPAAVGSIVGVPIGVAASSFFLGNVAIGADLKLPMPNPADPLIDLGCLVGVTLLVGLAAIVPALQAARANTIKAIGMGLAPRTARRTWLGALLFRVGAGPGISLGAGDAFARPVRAALTVTALGIGIATLTFAFTFAAMLRSIVDDPASLGVAQDANVVRYGSLSDADAMAIINGDPGTKAVLAVTQVPATVAGRAKAEPLIALRGDAPGFGYRATAGRWYSAPGEAVVGSLAARDARLRPGDSFSVTVAGHSLVLRVVGIANDLPNAGRGFRVDWATLTQVMPAATPDLYMVQLRPGTDTAAYVARLTAENSRLGVQGVPNKAYVQPATSMIDGLIGGLTVVLALIAAIGVFNAMLLATRERVHDIATLKSVGMTPVQIGVMVATAACAIALVGALLGIPLGIWLLGVISGAMGDLYGLVVDSGSALNPVTAAFAVFGSVVVALAGAALPTRWAAATPPAQVLRAE